MLKQLLLCPLIFQFLLLVMVNGTPEANKPKSLYPFSKAQLVNRLDQQEMDKCIEGAKHWDKKLEQILIKYKDNLKSFFSADGKLKSREDYLREAFNEAIKINKNLMDLIEILVTATGEEKETFKKLAYCEELKKISKRKLVEIFEVKELYVEILYKLCSTQRETTFDKDKDKEEIEKDRETLAELKKKFLKSTISTNPWNIVEAPIPASSEIFDHKQLIPMFTTKSYAYLREVFAKDNNSALKFIGWYYEYTYAQSKLYKVIGYILKDALDGRPEFFSEFLYNSLKVLQNKTKPIFDKNKQFFTNYAQAHKVFQRILVTRAQIDLADIVKVDKDNNKSLESFGHAIGTLKEMQKHYNKNDKKLFDAYIEILEMVQQEHAGIN